MSTVIRPEVSKKNKYWIERHRYYELKHFCLQYPIWKKAFMALDSLSKQPDKLSTIQKTNLYSDPTYKCVESREYYRYLISLIDDSVDIACDDCIGGYILKGVTEGYTYDYLKTNFNIPCSRDIYYNYYRKFFWILNKARK